MSFKGCEGQFDWLEKSLVYKKSDKHRTIYENYNAEYPARMLKNTQLSNISDAYGTTNTMKFDINSGIQNHLLWKQYIA